MKSKRKCQGKYEILERYFQLRVFHLANNHTVLFATIYFIISMTSETLKILTAMFGFATSGLGLYADSDLGGIRVRRTPYMYANFFCSIVISIV